MDESQYVTNSSNLKKVVNYKVLHFISNEDQEVLGYKIMHYLVMALKIILIYV